MQMQDLNVHDSTIAVIHIGILVGVPIINNSITVADTVISDWTIPSQIDMISIGNLQSVYEFGIIFQNFTFINIDFMLGGNLIKYSQLLSNSFELTNSSFSNITGGRINIESFTADTNGLTTKVLMTNIDADNINSEYGSFIELQTGADVNIVNSRFTNIDSYEKGSVIFASFELTNTVIQNSVFENNTSINGGAIYIEQQSRVECTNWTFINNFAVEGGVVSTADNGMFVFINSMFQNNQAESGIIANIYDSALISSFVNSTIQDNTFVSKDMIIEEISGSWSLLCYFKSTFKLYLASNTRILDVIQSPFMIKLVIGNIDLVDTKVYRQSQFVDAYQSIVNLNRTRVTDIIVADVFIKFIISTMIIDNLDIVNVTNPHNYNYAMISGSTESTINSNEITYSDND